MRHLTMRVRLFDWAPSPFCMKVRAILGRQEDRCGRIAAPLRGPGTGRKSPGHITDDLRREHGALGACMERMKALRPAEGGAR